MPDACHERLPDLDTVLFEAVDCRNHFVHGSKTKINYVRNEYLFFFVDTLEFVFAASELIDSGWDITRWMKQWTSLSHPFSRFMIEYNGPQKRLRKDLETVKHTIP